MQPPKLRDSCKRASNNHYPLGDVPVEVINKIGKRIAAHFATGKSDISGQDWGDIFSKSIAGEHLNSTRVLADVVKGKDMAWSVKSVKHDDPFNVANKPPNKPLRIISGRNSPYHSCSISDPLADTSKTGQAVLSIWNKRVDEAKDRYKSLRSLFLIRNLETLNFAIYEHEIAKFNTEDYIWKVNGRGNFQGYRASDERHVFTWQPSGGQFTIKYYIPAASVTKFRIKRPPQLDFNATLALIGFDTSWIEIIE